MSTGSCWTAAEKNNQNVQALPGLVQRWSQIALVNSVVVDLPPRSPVLYFPSAIVFSTASWILSALSWSSKCLSIDTELRSNAVGFARFCINNKALGKCSISCLILACPNMKTQVWIYIFDVVMWYSYTYYSCKNSSSN